MELKAEAKINLSLDVTGRRDDGYHFVRMVMQSVTLCDTLFVDKKSTPGVDFFCDTPGIPTDGSNLCIKAFRLMDEVYHLPGGVRIRLEKKIPAAAGLAGGSSDAAAVMKAVNAIFSLGLSDGELMKTAVRIGADVPYCILGGTALAEGIGEVLTPLPEMPDCTIVLAKPREGISTKEVYAELDRIGKYRHPNVDGQIKAIRNDDLAGAAAMCGNVLEYVTRGKTPEIRHIESIMSAYGAEAACMSGSGPTVFGIFRDAGAASACAGSFRETGYDGDVFVTRPSGRKNGAGGQPEAGKA